MTSTTAYRYWNWDPSNDRDFIGLPVTTISAAPSKQNQWTQEVRYAGALSSHLNVVAGVFGFHQALDSNPSFKQEQGSAAARFLLAPTRGGGDAGPARRLRLRPVPDVPEHQRGGVRPARMDRHRSPSHAPGSAIQLRREGRGLQPARLWRPADDEPGADCAQALGPRAAGVHGGRRRHEHVRSADGRVSRSPTRSTRMRPTRPASSRSA